MNSPHYVAIFQEETSSIPVEEKQRSITPPSLATALPNLNIDSGAGFAEPKSAVVNKRLQNMFYLRLVTFFVIELGFITLAAACLGEPISLNIKCLGRFSSTQTVRGGLTIIFIIWQSLAVVAAEHILADSFSREWSAQLPRLIPGTTDRVSTVTSGLLDRILHFFTKRASGTFKLAFIASLCLMALTRLAPGAISATFVNLPITIEIGNLLARLDDDTNLLFLMTAGIRASSITRLEQIDGLTFGLRVQPNWIIPQPAPGFRNLTAGMIEYDTDVVEFHYACHWEAAKFVNRTAVGVKIEAAGLDWTTELAFGSGIPASSIRPLSLKNRDIIQNVSTSVFLFVGGNDTFQNHNVTPPVPFAINLGTLPATFVATGVGVNAGPGQNFVGPLASVLICNPNSRLSGGRVRLSPDDHLSVIASGRPTIGNLSPSAANIFFRYGLFIPTKVSDSLGETTDVVNDVGSRLFMETTPVSFAPEGQGSPSNIDPLDTDSINKNMDTFMLSASKAFTDGYRSDGGIPNLTLSLSTVSGQGQGLALTTSKGLFHTVMALFVITLLVLSALCQSALTQSRYLFDLRSVVMVLREGEWVSVMRQGQQNNQSPA